MRFAAVGFICVDVYNDLGHRYATGNGIDLMFNLKGLVPDLSMSVVSAIGDDANGRLMLDACHRRGADTSHIRIVPGGKTAEIQMLLNGRDRVHHHAERGVMPTWQPSGEDMDFIRTQDYIHTDLSWQVTDLLKDMRKNGTHIYFDFSKRWQHPDVDRILKNIDYGIFSFEEETDEVRDLLMHGCHLGARALLATFGEKGSLCCDGTRFYHQSAIPAPHLVNTVGAGDSFGGGFLSGIIDGCGLDECLRRGAETASKIVSIFEPYPLLPGEASCERRL